MDNLILWLQHFAEAGTLVNATGNFVNAYTGDTTAFDNKNSLSGELKDFYDTELLENARHKMYYAQFGKKVRLPAHHNGRAEFRKWNTFKQADQLVEGVIPTGQKFGMTSLFGVINQYGTYTAITDKLQLRAYDDVILGATEEMGASASETQEALTRDALAVGTNVYYCPNYTLATGAVESTPSTEDGIKISSTVASRITATDINKIVTIMKKNKVPQINNRFYAVIHPSVAFDLRESEGWIEAHKYASPEQLFNGEIGELHGVRFIEDEFAPVVKPTGKYTTKVKTAYTSGTTLTIEGKSTDTADLYNGLYLTIKHDGVWYNVGAISDSGAYNSGVALTITAFGDADFDAGDEVEIYTNDVGAGMVYYTYFFGKDGFGIIDPEGGSLEMIVHDKDEIGGPLNQFSTIGYKFETNGATILYNERVLRCVSASTFSADDVEN